MYVQVQVQKSKTYSGLVGTLVNASPSGLSCEAVDSGLFLKNLVYIYNNKS